MAVLAAVVRGFARRSATTIGNFWVDLYRSLAYILLPLALHPRGDPRLAGRRPDVRRACDRDDASRAASRRSRAARPRRRSRSSSSARTAAASTTRTRPCRSRTRPAFTNFLEMLSILLIPAAQVFMFGRMVSARRQALPIFGAMFAMFVIGVAVALPSEQHGSQVLRDSGVNITQRRRLERRQHVRQGGPLRHRLHRRTGRSRRRTPRTARSTAATTR